MINPGINHYITGCSRIEDFLAYKDKEFATWYANEADERVKKLLAFIYSAGFRFCGVDTNIIYMLNGVRDIYTDKKLIKKIEETNKE